MNNSATTAQAGEEGEYDEIVPVHIQELTPATSGLHNEGRFDSNNAAADATLDEARQYQLQIADSISGLYNNDGDTTGLVTGCNRDAVNMPTPGYLDDDGSTRLDLLIPWICGQNLVGSTTEPYYWRVRYLEDTDGDNAVSTDDLWGLWSETNMFYIDESGTITLNTCSVGTDHFQLGTALDPFDSATGDNFKNDTCSFFHDGTTQIYLKVAKDQEPTHSVNTDVVIWDMEATEEDPLTGLDGENDSGDLENESGFYIDNITNSTTTFTIGVFKPFHYYDDYYSQIPDTATTILTSSGGYTGEYFEMIVGAFINGLIPDPADPISNIPDGICGYTDGVGGETHNACTSLDGTYSATVTLTSATSP